MNIARGFGLLAAVVLSTSACYAQQGPTLIPANSVISLRTTAQPPVVNPANLFVSFAAKRYTLTISSANKNDDGLVGINFPALGQGLFPDDGGLNKFVKKFVRFTFDMAPGAGQPADANFPFACVVQDKNDGFYHASNGSVTTTGNPAAPFRFTADVVNNTWNAPFTTGTPWVQKVALVFSGDFGTPVKSVQIFVTGAAGRNPKVNSSNNNNDIPNANNPPGGGIDFSYNLSPQGPGTSDPLFNFDTADNGGKGGA